MHIHRLDALARDNDLAPFARALCMRVIQQRAMVNGIKVAKEMVDSEMVESIRADIATSLPS